MSRLGLLLLTWLTVVPALAGPPRLLASIAPLHGIAAAVGAGRAEVARLFPPDRSPHLHALRPSEARRLAAAELVVWIGPMLETALARALPRLAAGAEVVTVAELPGLRRLPRRVGHQDAARAGLDPHLWLDPDNGRRIARALAERLVRRDPAGAEIYRRNLARFEARLDAVVAQLRARLAPVRDRPFLLAHDSLQYFERAFGLAGLGAVSVSPELPPGARGLLELLARARGAGVVCVFAEPQLDRRRVERLAERLGARIGTVDPLGRDIAPGPDFYPELLRRVGESVRACLAVSGQ